jgi:hypothetical protein
MLVRSVREGVTIKPSSRSLAGVVMSCSPCSGRHAVQPAADRKPVDHNIAPRFDTKARKRLKQGTPSGAEGGFAAGQCPDMASAVASSISTNGSLDCKLRCLRTESIGNA